MPLAKKFKKWVYGEVLPTILRTGAYSAYKAKAAAQASEADLWNQKRLDGIHLHKLKSACLQKLIACCAGGDNWQVLYKVVNGAIGRAILDYNDTKAGFFKRNQLPDHASIPDLLDYDGQLLRSTMERRYHTHMLDNWKELQAMTLDGLKSRFNELGAQMQEGNRVGGYTVIASKLLTLEDMTVKKKGFKVAVGRGLKPSHRVLSLEQPYKKQKTLGAFMRKCANEEAIVVSSGAVTNYV